MGQHKHVTSCQEGQSMQVDRDVLAQVDVEDEQHNTDTSVV